MNEEYWNNVAKQKEAYKELDKFVAGEGGLAYFPVPVEELKQWQKDQDRKNMEAYEKREREKNNAVLEIREEEVRGNGHHYNGTDLSEALVKINPDQCDLKNKKSTRKRASNSKNKK